VCVFSNSRPINKDKESKIIEKVPADTMKVIYICNDVKVSNIGDCLYM
jgi:hypothetical protein